MSHSAYSQAHDLAGAVARLNRRLRQERRSALTASQLSVLSAVRAMGVATPGAVAARERVQPPTVTRVLNALDEAGLVMREPHPDDGRQVLISVSELGEQILTRERDRRDEWLAAQLGSLTTDERALLTGAAAVLERIATE